MPTDRTLSLNCARATREGRAEQHGCSGCPGCTCHHVPMPPDFWERAGVARSTSPEDAPGTRGDARPGADGGRR